jgi:hypothetical protein
MRAVGTSDALLQAERLDDGVRGQVLLLDGRGLAEQALGLVTHLFEPGGLRGYPVCADLPPTTRRALPPSHGVRSLR